jgi:hypothetical protein
LGIAGYTIGMSINDEKTHEILGVSEQETPTYSLVDDQTRADLISDIDFVTKEFNEHEITAEMSKIFEGVEVTKDNVYEIHKKIYE